MGRNTRTNLINNPVLEEFDAGIYSVTPINDPFFDLKTAWSAWNVSQHNCDTGTSICDNSGPNVEDGNKGYMNQYTIGAEGEFAAFSTYDGLIYLNFFDAFDNALSTSFTLTTTTMVQFYIFDCVGCQFNNSGGMTLDIQLVAELPAVPEPSTLAIFLVGLAGLGFVTRRRRTGVGETMHAS